jgi:lipopolysaccharide transport system ATP-binding protein
MTRPIIEVNGLAKRYRLGAVGATSLRDFFNRSWEHLRRRHDSGEGDFWALRDVSFAVQPGEVVGVIGRNGAGKSTLLKILSRITEPTEGSAILRGRVASLLEVGTGFHPELTGRENIMLNGAILGMTRAEVRRKFDEIVAFSEIGCFIDTPVKRYSSGMYVRLAFAVAAHLEPEILIVDEVLAVGDAAFQQKCLGKMETIASRQGRTIFFVSHQVAAVARFCTRALLFEQGRLAVDGTIGSALGSYCAIPVSATAGWLTIDSARRQPDSPLELLALTINGGSKVLHREALRIVVECRVLRATSGGFGVGLTSMDGKRLVTLESDHDGSLFTLSSPGRHEVRLELPVLDLTPGLYRVDVGAFGPGHREYHYHADCGALLVERAQGTPPHLRGSEMDWRPSARWEIRPATTD